MYNWAVRKQLKRYHILPTMNIKKTITQSPLFMLMLLLALMVSSCFPSFNTEDEVMEYLKKKFPDQNIVLSSSRTTKRGWISDIRIWTFTLSGYPKDTFKVASYISSYPFPMMKTRKGMMNDFDKVVTLRCAKEFEQGELKKFDAATQRIWARFSEREFSLDAATLVLENIDDIWRAKRLIEAFELYLSRENNNKENRYYLQMNMQGKCYKLMYGKYIMFSGPNREDGEDGANDTKRCKIKYHYNYHHDNLEELCIDFCNGVMKFHQRMADEGNGVNDKTFQEWAENQLRLKDQLAEMSTKEERDSLFKRLVIGNKSIHHTLIDLGEKPYMLAALTDSAYYENDRGIFFTYPQLRAFCLRSGLKVQGTGDHFTVTGVNGSRYEFNCLFAEQKKDSVVFDEDKFYYLRDGHRVNIKKIWSPYECVHEDLVRQITGRDLRKMMVNSLKD